MKQTRKLLAILAAVLMLCSMLTVGVYAEDPAADSTLTIPEAIALAQAQASNSFTTDKYYVSGVINNIVNTTYGNMYIIDEEGNSLYIYGVNSADGSVRYDALETKPQVGDTVTLYGIIGQYGGTLEMKAAWLTDYIPATTPAPTPELERDPANPQKYVFDDFTAGAQYGKEMHYLDNAVTVNTDQAWFTTELRMYWSPRATATITSTKAISAIVLNAGYNQDTLQVYISEDGEVYQSVEMTTTAYRDYTVLFPETTHYIKLQVKGSHQVRIPYMTLYFDGKTPDEVICTEHTYTGDYDATCNICWEEREVSFPRNGSTLTIVEANTIGQSLDKGGRTDNNYYVSGTIVKIDAEYRSVFIRDKEGNEFYGFSCTNFSTKNPQVGDVITLYGCIANYNGTVEMSNGNIYGDVKRPISFQGNSVSEDVSGLAFRFSLKAEGIAIKKGTYVQADFTNATYEGYQLLRVGVVASNGNETIEIDGLRAYELEETSASFAYRIINIPTEAYDTQITMTPFFVVMIDGEEVTIYGETQTASYNEILEENA